MRTISRVCAAALLVAFCLLSNEFAMAHSGPHEDGWVDVGGNVHFGNTPVCALVLINGQTQFSCDGTGRYDMEVPIDDNGMITVQVYADGFAPFNQIVTPAQAAAFPIDMLLDQNSPSFTVETTYEPSATDGRFIISGTIKSGTTPVCALALANGQSMFSCGENLGQFSLEVPVDPDGNITLFVYAAGFKPYKIIINPADAQWTCSDGGVPAGGPAIRGIKFWMSNNPPDLFNDYLGLPFDSEHYESWHDVLLEAKCAGVNDVTFQLSTGVMEYPTDNTYLDVDMNPSEAALLALANDAQSMGMSVTVSLFTHTQNVITGSDVNNQLDRPQPTDRPAWLQAHRVRVLKGARLAKLLGARAFIYMQDETQHLLRDPTLTNQWVSLMRDVRAEYPGLITSVWWANGGGTSITEIPDVIINDLDYLGIGFFPNLVRSEAPSLQALCSAYHQDADGNDPVAFLRSLSERYGKRIWITDKAFHSFKGASYDEGRIFNNAYVLEPDQALQARLYDSFLSVMYNEGAGWLEGISFQNFNNLRDGANPWIARFVDGPISESPQHKLAEGVMGAWFGGRRTNVCDVDLL